MLELKPPIVNDLPYPLWEYYNQYRCPPAFSSSDRVVDIGTNDGGSCLAFEMKGAGKVIGFEPSMYSFAVARENTKKYPNIELYHKAVWRSDVEDTKLYYKETEEGYLTLSMVNNGDGDVAVETVSLDEIIERFSPIRFLKVDTEGSEYPIILTSKRLSEIQQIGMEVHLFQPEEFNSVSTQGLDLKLFGGPPLADFIRSQGFKVEYVTTGDSGLAFIYAVK